MNAPVVRNTGLNHLVPALPEYFGNAPPEKIIAKMTEVQWFIRIRRRVLHHHLFILCRLLAVICIGVVLAEKAYPIRIFYRKIEESLYYVE